jgi:hypothetical protein
MSGFGLEPRLWPTATSRRGSNGGNRPIADIGVSTEGSNYQLYGGNGADTFTAGGFSQSGVTYNGYIEGGDGGDEYFFSATSGSVAIVENGATGTDILIMGNTLAADVRIFNDPDGVSKWITSAADMADGVPDNGIFLYDWAHHPTIEHFYDFNNVEFFL